jgi:putative transposase
LFRSQLIPLDLTVKQARYMAQAAGTARFVYNWALEEWKRQASEWWSSGKVTPYPSVFALQKQFNAIKRAEYPWVTQVASEVANKAIFSVGVAFEAFEAGTARYPKFKSRDGRQSFVGASSHFHLYASGRRLRLPRVGSIRLGCLPRWSAEYLRSAHVSERAGRWYVALGYLLPSEASAPKPGAYAGVDLGIKTPLVATSGDVTLQFGAELKERLNVERRKLRRANQRLHRRVKGSGRRQRAKQRVARIHQRMANIRSDMQHKATHLIAGMAPRIGVETLAVRNMMQNGRLARSIADVGFYEIKRQLKYKAVEVVEADRFYPSSKTCSACGSIKQDLVLSDRVFRCEHCGHECDRDVNAARNLERMAANWAVSARGAGSPAPKRKLRLSSLAVKREAQDEAHNEAHREVVAYGGQDNG